MKKKECKCLLIFLLSVVGTVLIVLGAESSWKDDKILAISNVIDVGGSGTRLYVFEYSPGFKSITQHKIKCEDRGLGNYKPEEYKSLRETLIECYKKGRTFLPGGTPTTPIWVGATAGMRLLQLRDTKGYHRIWTLVNDTLKASNYKIKFSDTLPGEHEAKFYWLAVNILKRTLRSKKKVGLVESGSISVLLAFAVKNETANLSIDTVDVGGKETKLYEHSYLCYGDVELFRKLQAEIVKDSNYSQFSEDPCSFKGYRWQQPTNYLWSVPCVKGDYAKQHFGYEIRGPANDTIKYNITGTGNATACLLRLKSMLPTLCKNNKHCGMEDVFQPEMRGKFLAIGNFYYATKFLGLTYNGNFREYLDKVVHVCSLPYKEVVEQYGPETKYTSKRCFHSVMVLFLLKNGFKFDNATSNHHRDLEYTRKINGVGVEWPLGLAYNYRNEGYFYTPINAEKLSAQLKFGFGVLVLIMAIMIVFSIVFKFKSTRQTVQYQNSDSL